MYTDDSDLWLFSLRRSMLPRVALLGMRDDLLRLPMARGPSHIEDAEDYDSDRVGGVAGE